MSLEERLDSIVEKRDWNARKLQRKIYDETKLDFYVRTVKRWLNGDNNIRHTYREVMEEFIEKYE